MKVAIAGFGYVGRAFYEFFKSHYEVVVYDNSREICAKFEFVADVPSVLGDADLVVVCVPTPCNTDGSADISQVTEVLGELKSNQLVLIKSTIPPRSTDEFSRKFAHLRLVFSPEYIGESDFYLPPPYDFSKEVVKSSFFIFGGAAKDTREMVEIFARIAGPVKEYIQTTALNAELCKYMENAFFACKIIFCNEFAHICEAFGADYNAVRELWLKDPRITKTHTSIYDNGESYFGGKCLPKDLSGIIASAKKAGYEAKFLQTIKELNRKESK